jgi:hypothetical protein
MSRMDRIGMKGQEKGLARVSLTEVKHQIWIIQE